MNTIMGKVAAGLLGLFMLVYIGYQAYQYIYSPYKTEIVYEYVVSDTVQAKGIVTRDEHVIIADSTGTVAYNVAEAQKVSVHTTLATVYNSPNEARAVQRITQIEEEIAMLKRISEPGSRNFVNVEMMAAQLQSTTGQLLEIAQSGNVKSAHTLKQQMSESINKTQLSLNITQDFSNHISQLEQEKQSLKASMGGAGRTVACPGQGYFSKYVDGQESLSYAQIKDMSTASIEELIAGSYPKQREEFGKLISSHNWYFTAVVSAEDAHKFTPGRTATANFSAQRLQDIPVEVYSVRTEGDKAIVTLRSDAIVPGVFSLRATIAEINFKTYSGLRVDSTAVRMVDGQVGVYVVTGYDIKFKPIEVLYDAQGYKLCKISYSDKQMLNLFDEIIVEGVDLYHGKPAT